MNKKIFLMISVLFFGLSAANAASDKIHVTTVNEFNTKNPSQKIDVKVVEEGILGSHVLKTDDVIHCNVIKVTDPKRGKRAASFAVCPISYTSEGNTISITENYYGKYAARVLSKEELQNVDAKKVGKKAAVTVGNYFVKGVAPAVSMAEGMVKNQEGNRIESGIKQVYKDSPLSYVEKGNELDLVPGEQFYLIFKPSKSKNSGDIAEEILEEE